MRCVKETVDIYLISLLVIVQYFKYGNYVHLETYFLRIVTDTDVCKGASRSAGEACDQHTRTSSRMTSMHVLRVFVQVMECVVPVYCAHLYQCHKRDRYICISIVASRENRGLCGINEIQTLRGQVLQDPESSFPVSVTRGLTVAREETKLQTRVTSCLDRGVKESANLGAIAFRLVHVLAY